jgi:phage baseplate assembly protein W
MQPEFGCDIWKIIFEPIIEGDIESKIENSILDAVNTWLPYLNIDTILFDYDDNDIDTNKIQLEIQFSLKSNSSVGSSVTIDIK